MSSQSDAEQLVWMVVLVGATVLLFSGALHFFLLADSQTLEQRGGDGQRCYPNLTCDDGLRCYRLAEDDHECRQRVAEERP